MRLPILVTVTTPFVRPECVVHFSDQLSQPLLRSIADELETLHGVERIGIKRYSLLVEFAPHVVEQHQLADEIFAALADWTHRWQDQLTLFDIQLSHPRAAEAE